MQYRKLGNTDLLVSEVGFGAWAIGGDTMIGDTAIGWGKAEDRLSIGAIHAAKDNGINFFDTADIYGLGHSEELLGKTIGSDSQIIIATKVGNVSRDGRFTYDYSRKHILSACEKSLKRLQRQTIDFYQLHSARMEHLLHGECIEAMQYLQETGKIRYWGLSLNTFEPLPEAYYLLGNDLGHGFQLVLNILNQRSLPVLEKANAKGYGVIARMPLQFGLLTGKYDRNAVFAKDDHRNNRLTPSIIEATEKGLQPAWALCEKYRCTKTQLALSFALSYPGVSTVIAGIRTAEQASQNTTGLFMLDEKDRAMIENLGVTEFTGIMKLVQQQG